MIKKYLTIFFLSLISTYELPACTGLRLTAANQTIVTGRTVEFGTPLDMFAAVIPKNFAFTGKAPSGAGLAYTSKYGAVGIYCFDYQVLMDGINEEGLVAAAFWFSGYAEYATITKANQAKALSPVEFPNWILTQFATIDEVKAALPSVVIGPTVIESWGDTPPPLHYVVYDKTGKSIVIEPRGGTLVVYENEIGAFTNSPTFDWHMTNLINFLNLSPFNVASRVISGVELTPFGQGSGLVGLPGDFTPPSRFVRAAIFSTTALPSKNAGEAVYQAFHLLNQFDIPKGAVREKEGSTTSFDYTMLTSVKDPQSLIYYFRTYDDQTIRSIQLSQFDLEAKEIKSRTTKGKQSSVDASPTLTSSSPPRAGRLTLRE